MRGSRTIAVASFAPQCATVRRSTCSAFCWIVWSSVRTRSLPSLLRPRLEDVDRRPARILDDRLLPGLAAQRLVVAELEPFEALVVDAGEADDLRRDALQRVDALLLGIGADAEELAASSELLRLRRVGLARDVDEARVPVRERRVERGRVDVEDRATPRATTARGSRDVARVGVDRRPLLRRPRARARAGRGSSRAAREA